MRCRGRPNGDLDADVVVARTGSRGEGQLTRRNAHDGSVMPVQRVDVVGAESGSVDERGPFGRECGDKRARYGA